MSNKAATTMQGLQAEIDALKAEKVALNKAAKSEVSMKVGPKGGLSVYGLGSRFPITLYRDQWVKLFGLQGDVEDFLAANEVK